MNSGMRVRHACEYAKVGFTFKIQRDSGV